MCGYSVVAGTKLTKLLKFLKLFNLPKLHLGAKFLWRFIGRKWRFAARYGRFEPE